MPGTKVSQLGSDGAKIWTLGVCLRGREEAWIELGSWRISNGRMTEGGKPGGIVRLWALRMSGDELQSSLKSGDNELQEAESCPQGWKWSPASTSYPPGGPDADGCGNGPGRTGWVLEISVRVIESPNVASRLTVSSEVLLSSPLLAFGKANASREQRLLPPVPEGHSQYQSWWRDRLDLSGYLLNFLLNHCSPWPNITPTLKLLAHPCLGSSVNSRAACSLLLLCMGHRGCEVHDWWEQNSRLSHMFLAASWNTEPHAAPDSSDYSPHPWCSDFPPSPSALSSKIVSHWSHQTFFFTLTATTVWKSGSARAGPSPAPALKQNWVQQLKWKHTPSRAIASTKEKRKKEVKESKWIK